MRSDPAPSEAPAPRSATRRLHALTLLFSAISVGRGFLLPAILGGASAGGGDVGRMFTWGLAILSVPALGVAVAKYLTFRYTVGAGELVLDSGVLNRRRRVIPLARIQNIEVRRNALARLFGVAELRVETAAGGDPSEAVLEVVAEEEARRLNGMLLRGRETGPAAPGRPERTVLAHLSPRDLFLAGATANEAGLIAAGLAGALQILEDLPVPLPRFGLDPGMLPETSVLWIAVAVAGLLLAFVVIGWIFSIGGALVGYYDFTLERVGGELRKRYGSIARREAAVPLERVQAIRIEESLLRRPFGLATIKIETAGSVGGEGRGGGAEAFLPLARAGEIGALATAVFPDLDYDAVALRSVDSRSRRRAFIRYAVPVVAATGALFWLAGTAGLAALALLPLAAAVAAWQYRHRGYGTAPGYVAARAGVWNRVTWIIPERKVQTLHMRESLPQRRHGLATIGVDTASGGRWSEARIVDLDRPRAERLLDRLAARVTARRDGG